MAGPEDSLSAANTYPLTDLTASLLGYDKDGGNEGIEQLSGGSYGVLSWNDEDMINEYLSSSDKFPHVITLEKTLATEHDFFPLTNSNCQEEYPMQSTNTPNLIGDYSLVSETDEVHEVLIMPSESNKKQFSDSNVTVSEGNHEVKSHVPKVGMEFSCEDDAYKFYQNYAEKEGFKVRKSKIQWENGQSNGSKRKRYFVCSQEGKKPVKNTKFTKKETRTGCDAKIRLTFKEDKCSIYEFIPKHNHDLQGSTQRIGIQPINENGLAKEAEVGAYARLAQGFGTSSDLSSLEGISTISDFEGMGSVKKLLEDVFQIVQKCQTPTRAVPSSSGATSDPTPEKLKQAKSELKAYLQQPVGNILLDNNARNSFHELVTLLVDNHALLKFYLTKIDDLVKHLQDAKVKKETAKSKEEEHQKKLKACNEQKLALQSSAIELENIFQNVQTLEAELLVWKKKMIEKKSELDRMYLQSSGLSRDTETILKSKDELETLQEEIMSLEIRAKVGWNDLGAALQKH